MYSKDYTIVFDDTLSSWSRFLVKQIIDHFMTFIVSLSQWNTSSRFYILDCTTTRLEKEYTGHHRITMFGRTCQRWDSQTPHGHDRNKPSIFPDATLEDAANYCRNPDNENGLWCYTTDPDKRWEYCDVPKCEGNQSPSFTILMHLIDFLPRTFSCPNPIWWPNIANRVLCFTGKLPL